MKLTEKILIALIVIAIILKFTFVPGAGPLLVITCSSLAILYFNFGFAFFNGIRLRRIFKKEAYSGTNAWRIVGAIAAGFCVSNLVLGIQFKLMSWPGANPLIFSIFIPCLIVLAIVIIKLFRSSDVYYKRILLRLATWGTFSLIAFITPTMALIRLQFKDHPRFINAAEDYYSDPTDENWERMDLERQRTVMSPEDFKAYEEYRTTTFTKTPVISKDTVKQKPEFPQRIGFCNDFAKTFTQEETKELEDLLKKYHRDFGFSIIVVTLDSLDMYKNSGDPLFELHRKYIPDQNEYDHSFLIYLSVLKRETVLSVGDTAGDILTEKDRDHLMNKTAGHAYLKQDKYFKGVKEYVKLIGYELAHMKRKSQ